MMPEAELRRLERARAGTLALIEGRSQEALDRRPATKGWSVGEILDHLLRAEAANREDIRTLIGLARSGREPYLRRGLTPTGLAPAFVPRGLLPYLSVPASIATLFVPISVRELMVRSRLFPASASAELQPVHGRPAGELRSQLAASVAETRALLAANDSLDCHRMTVQHPFLGANDVHDILRLTAAHEERHQD